MSELVEGTGVTVEAANALAEAAATAPTTTEEAAAQAEASKRPEGLPEKFNSWADMAKAYAELEAKQSGKDPDEDDTAQEDAPEATEETAAEDDADKNEEVSADKVDIASIEAEYAEKGEISEENYAKLEKAGFSREVVDSYKRGQEALAQIATQRITDAAGGKDEMERVFTWAKTGMTSEQIDAANAVFASGDVDAAVLKMEEVRAAYSKATGADPKKQLQGEPGKSLTTYESWAQVTADMNSKKYKTDPAFRAKVEAKLARSSI